jgi:hypothetical protein
MRVKHAGKYLGQFDCSKCQRLKQLQVLIAGAKTDAERVELQLEGQRCRRHEETKNLSVVSTSCSGLISSRGSFSS